MRTALPTLLSVAWGIGVFCAASGGVAGTRAAEPASPAVRLELLIPPAEHYVIGDSIPLAWRFRNNSTQSLAFMWEGCCRLNGRLEVAQGDTPLLAIPPGQSTAHRFARAESVTPGTARDFETRVGDWVRIERSGTYTLRGRYTGVLPEQRPQTPRGSELWRGTAHSAPVALHVLSVTDYLAERETRSAKRAVRLELAGPRAFPPLTPTPFTLQVSNAGPRRMILAWPADLDLWLVRSDGQRIEGLSNGIEAGAESVELAAGETARRTFAIDPSRLEGEPFGDVLVFAEMRPTTAAVRVPSNALNIAWDLPVDAVRDLLQRAAAGPATGSRNAPLKRLRVYLREIESHLAALDPARLDGGAARLRAQLLFAAALKPLAPAPGAVEVLCTPAGRAIGAKPPAVSSPAPATIEGGVARRTIEEGRSLESRDRASDESWRVLTVASNPCPSLVGLDLPEALRRLCEVRRHLGWEPRVRLAPAPATTLGAVGAALRALEPLQPELADQPGIVVTSADSTSPGVVRFASELPPRGLQVRLRAEPGTTGRILETRSAPTGAGTSVADPIGLSVPWVRLPPDQPVDRWLVTRAEQGIPIALLAAPTLAWGEVQTVLLPFAARSLPSLVVLDTE